MLNAVCRGLRKGHGQPLLVSAKCLNWPASTSISNSFLRHYNTEGEARVKEENVPFAQAEVSPQTPLESRPSEFRNRKDYRSDGPVYAKLTNVPRYAIASELLDIFPGCNLTLKDVSSVLDEKLRTSHWCVRFPSKADFEIGKRRSLNGRRIGTRVVIVAQYPPSLLREENNPQHPNRVIINDRGRAILMLNCPEETNAETVERFFEGYSLAPNPIFFMSVTHEQVKTPLRMRLKGEHRPYIDLRERRTIVKFSSAMEAYRALREKSREFLDDHSIELKMIH